MPAERAGTRVLVVDDNPIFSDLLVQAVAAEAGMQIAGVARDRKRAVRMAAHLKPDVIAVDVNLPRMHGLDIVSEIMSTTPTPILVLTRATGSEIASLSFDAIDRGALDVMSKPLDSGSIRQTVGRLKQLAGVPVIYRPRRAKREGERQADGRRARGALRAATLGHPGRVAPPPRPVRKRKVRVPTAPPSEHPTNTMSPPEVPVKIIGVAASTGGPAVLAEVLGALPGNFPIPILVVQHTSDGFDEHLVRWLNAKLALAVSLAADGDTPAAGEILIGSKEGHLRLGMSGRVSIDRDTPPYKGHVPSANVLFESLARHRGASAAGIVLTGMGDDGAAGLLRLKLAGGLTIVQEGESCAVDGMPRAAKRRGAARVELSIDAIAPYLRLLARGSRTSSDPRPDQ